jgi:hypothetical protein
MTNPVNGVAFHADTIIRTESAGGAPVAVVQLTPPESWPEACTCGHLHAEHDAIAARYCAATILGSLDRGCVCAARPTASTEVTPAR